MERGPACDKAATESTVAAGSPRSSHPNRTASSPSETVMAWRAGAQGARVCQGFAGGFAGAGAAAGAAAGLGAREFSACRMAGVMSTVAV